jgi:hypothetical protein
MSRAALRHLRANILVRAVKAAKTQQVTKPSDKEQQQVVGGFPTSIWRQPYPSLENIVKFWSTFVQSSYRDICF